MKNTFDRREFLRTSAAFGATAAIGGLLPAKAVRAASIDVPVIDKLSIQVLVDSSFDLFLRPHQVNGVSVASSKLTGGYRRLPAQPAQRVGPLVVARIAASR